MGELRGFCETCFDMVNVSRVDEVSETVRVRGVEASVRNEYPICSCCGGRVSVPEYDDKNLQHAYDAYRAAFGIPTPAQIKENRELYGMSQRQYAALLGIGVASIQRYERGSLPADSHAEILRQACDSEYLMRRLREHPRGLTQKDEDAISRAISDRQSKETRYEYHLISLVDTIPSVANEFSGGTAFDADAFREVLVLLASEVRDLYKTKLNKALFYLDFSAFRDLGKGITGLRYARADFGPVPDGYEAWMPAFVDGESLSYQERENGGQVVVALRDARMGGFSKMERVQIAKVVAFVNGFQSVGALSEYSHGEDAWKYVRSGHLISYDFAKTLKGVK